MTVKTQADIEAWLTRELSVRLSMAQTDVGVDVPLSDFGLSSVKAAEFVTDLEDWLDFTVPATAVYSYPTVESLAKYLAGVSAQVKR